MLDVEGRRHSLRDLDNVVIPPGLAHAAQKASSEQAVLAHRDGEQHARDQAGLTAVAQETAD